MDMTEVKQFEQKVGVLKLSEAIRIGARALKNETNYRGCVLAAACYAYTGYTLRVVGNLHPGMRVSEWSNLVADMAGVSHELANDIEVRHTTGESRESIAGWLESHGL